MLLLWRSAAAAIRRDVRPGGSGSALLARRSLFIQVESTPNPDSLKFLPAERIVLDEKFGAGLHFDRAMEAVKAGVESKFARQLLKTSAVTSVFLGRDFVSVNKTENASWAALKPIVLSAMMDALSEAEEADVKGLAQDAEVAPEHVVQDDDDEVVAMIKELLETKIRPAVQEDGGDILFAGFEPDTGVVKVRLAGSCVGCPSSAATLRNGVEAMLAYYIPEVRSVREVKTEIDAVSDEALRTLESRLAAAGAPSV